MQERKNSLILNFGVRPQCRETKKKQSINILNNIMENRNKLQQAIDTLKQSNNSKLLLYGLETLYTFSKAQNMSYLFYIKQILKSVDFKRIVFQELDYQENKYQTYRRLVKMEEDKRFINYFINFIEEFMKLFTDYIYEYVQRFYKTVQIMLSHSKQFEQEEKQLQQFLEKLKNNMIDEPEFERENQLILKNQFEQYMTQQKNNLKSCVEQMFGTQHSELIVHSHSFRSYSPDDTFLEVTSEEPKRISDNYLSQNRNPKSSSFQVDIQNQAIQSTQMREYKRYKKHHDSQFRNFEL